MDACDLIIPALICWHFKYNLHLRACRVYLCRIILIRISSAFDRRAESRDIRCPITAFIASLNTPRGLCYKEKELLWWSGNSEITWWVTWVIYTDETRFLGVVSASCAQVYKSNKRGSVFNVFWLVKLLVIVWFKILHCKLLLSLPHHIVVRDTLDRSMVGMLCDLQASISVYKIAFGANTHLPHLFVAGPRWVRAAIVHRREDKLNFDPDFITDREQQANCWLIHRTGCGNLVTPPSGRLFP